MSSHHVIAQNYSHSSENRIHSDAVARQYGFKGALVPGVAVYGHLTYLLAQSEGERWLSHSLNRLRLFKPAYHQDQLTLTLSTGATATETADSLFKDKTTRLVACYNNQSEQLATLLSAQPAELPKGEYLGLLDNPIKSAGRVPISWDRVVEEQPFTPWQFDVSADENYRFAQEVSDNLTLYADYAHPHLLCALANTCLTNEYIMPTWIHVGTELRHHQAVRVGDTLTIRAVPFHKWKKKGHEFTNLYVGFWRGEELTTDLIHTAIYKVAH